MKDSDREAQLAILADALTKIVDVVTIGSATPTSAADRLLLTPRPRAYQPPRLKPRLDESSEAGHDDAEFTDAQAVASIDRITGGNFRLLHRLFTQIERVMKINELTVITDDVVEAARSTLVIGVT